MNDYIRHNVMWYTVWDAKTGDLVASGTAAMCARRLGYSSSGSFASAVSHWLCDGVSTSSTPLPAGVHPPQ